MTEGSKVAKRGALLLLAFANLSAGVLIAYGLRSGLRPMLILAVTGAIFNALLFVDSWFEPLYSHRELRQALRYFSLVNWFFICGAFAIAKDRYMIAALFLSAGFIVYFTLTHRHIKRLLRLIRLDSDQGKID
jgi:hypothetical protein